MCSRAQTRTHTKYTHLYICIYNHENDVDSRVRDGLIRISTHPCRGHQNIGHLHTQALRNHDIIIIYTYVRVCVRARVLL